jgi:hypothetical protein
MPFVIVGGAQGITVVIAVTAVAGIGKQPIRMGIITNPLSAAGGFRQVAAPTA